MSLARTVTVALAAALLSGCGSAQPPFKASRGRVAFALHDFYITPQKVQIRPGRVTFSAVNRGLTTHTLRVSDGVHDLLSITTLHPGQRGSASAVLKRGTYKLYDAIANHEQLGASGTLVVR